MHGCLFSLTLNAGVVISQVWLITLKVNAWVFIYSLYIIQCRPGYLFYKSMHGCSFSLILNAGLFMTKQGSSDSRQV